MDWSRVELWWGDERFLPDHADDRNAQPTRQTLAGLGLDPGRIHPMPAAGGSATAAMPVSVFSQCARMCITSSAPWTVEVGCSGWMSAKPGRRAMRSFRRGLCFMVHEPSG